MISSLFAFLLALCFTGFGFMEPFLLLVSSAAALDENSSKASSKEERSGSDGFAIDFAGFFDFSLISNI